MGNQRRTTSLAEIDRLSWTDPVMWLSQHAKVSPELTEDAGVYRMKRQAPVDTLYARKSITLRQHGAASMLYRDYALGVCGAKDFDDGERIPGIRVGTGDQYCVIRLDALERFRMAIRALGRHLTRVVFPVVCEEVDVKSAAQGRRERKEGTMALLRIALETLADHYKLSE